MAEKVSSEYLAGMFDATGDVYARAADGVVYSWLTFKVKSPELRAALAVEVRGRLVGKSIVKVGSTASRELAETIAPLLRDPEKAALVRDYAVLRAMMESEDTDEGALARFQRRQVVAERIMARKRPPTWARAVDAAGAAS